MLGVAGLVPSTAGAAAQLDERVASLEQAWLRRTRRGATRGSGPSTDDDLVARLRAARAFTLKSGIRTV